MGTPLYGLYVPLDRVWFLTSPSQVWHSVSVLIINRVLPARLISGTVNASGRNLLETYTALNLRILKGRIVGDLECTKTCFHYSGDLAREARAAEHHG